MLALTRRQREILEFIQQFIDTEGMPPTRADICRALGFRSPNAAQDHLRALERKGAIEVLAGTSRGIRVRGGPSDGLPLVGRVAAGAPILASEHVEGRYRIDPGLFSPRADYLLRVCGTSMRDAGIHDGDLLAVHRTPIARSGEIVVARIGDEVTVKRLQRDGDVAMLLPENPDFAPITVDLGREVLDIEGIGVGVIRNQLL